MCRLPGRPSPPPGERDHVAGRLAAVADHRIALRWIPPEWIGVGHREPDAELLDGAAGVEPDDVHTLAAEMDGELELRDHRAAVLRVAPPATSAM